jgi:hypothetical protein
MHRLTARLVLVLLLVGIFAPVALAFSATPPHACCLRKPLHRGDASHSQFSAVANNSRNCCPPVTTAQWASPGISVNAQRSLLVAALQTDPLSFHHSRDLRLSPCVRAPPTFSIA